MRKIFFCLIGMLMFGSCSDDKGVFIPDGIKEPLLPVETKPNEEVKGDVFTKLNLDYPGLEKVKQYYDAGEHYLAAKELLSYYRYRTNVVNPSIKAFVEASTIELNKADQALDYRFCVANYVEEENTSAKDDDVYYSFKKDDGSINWGWKPDNETVDREFYYQQHRHQWMEPQAKSYAATKNEEYIKNWIEVYSSWMEKYPCPNEAFDDPKIYHLEDGYEWKALQPTERVLSQINIIQYYLPSPNFTPEWLSVVMNAFAESVEMIRMNYIEDGNIRVSQGQAVFSAGILFPEFKNAEEWIKDGIKTMDTSIQFRNDGVHVDLDFGYHISAITDYLEVYKLAKANNRLDVIPTDLLKTLEKAVHFVADMIYPDYTVDNFNDTHSSTYNRSDVDPVNKVLQNRFKDYLEVFPNDQQLLWLAWDGTKGGAQPSWRSKAYSDAGYYMFRSKDWDMMMIHKNNENSAKKWHCQPDNGTFSLWYKGVNFLPDAGSYSYDDDGSGNTPRDTYRRYTLHNTLSYQGKDISESQQLGECLMQASGEDYDLIVTQNTPYKVGEHSLKGEFKHRRAIFFVDDKFFVVVDEAYSTSSEDNVKVNLNFHLLKEDDESVKLSHEVNNPQSVLYCTAKNNNKSLLMKYFYEKSTTDEKHYFASVKQADELPVSTKPGTQDGGERYWVKLNCEAAKGKAVRHITVLYPSDGDVNESIVADAKFTDNEQGQEGTFHPNGAAVEVTVDGDTYNLKYTL